ANELLHDHAFLLLSAARRGPSTPEPLMALERFRGCCSGTLATSATATALHQPPMRSRPAGTGTIIARETDGIGWETFCFGATHRGAQGWRLPPALPCGSRLDGNQQSHGQDHPPRRGRGGAAGAPSRRNGASASATAAGIR